MLTRFLLTPWLGNAREEGVGEVAEEELVHGHVPEAPVLREVLAVPPVLVEELVAVAGDFGAEGEDALEGADEEGVEDAGGDEGDSDELVRERGSSSW